MDGSLRQWQQNLEIGIKYLGDGNSYQAEKYLNESLKEAESLEVPVIIAFSQRLLATAQVKNNKIEEAEMGFSRALDICIQLNNNKGIAEAKAGLASIFFIKGEYTRSISLYKSAIKIYPTDSSPLRLAVLYSDLGQVYGKIKKWEKAEQVFLKAGDLCQQYGYSRGEAEINLYIGEVHYSQGKTKAAKEMFINSARIFGLIGDTFSLASVHQYLAFIYLENNMIDEALLCQDRVISLYYKYEQFSELSDGYYLLSNILQYAKLLDQAEECLKLSIKYYQGFEFGYAVRYHSLAVISLMRKEYEEAKNYYYNALKYFQLFGDGPKIGEISEELTYLLKYEDVYAKENIYKWLEDKYQDVDMPKYEVMLKLANSLKEKGNNIAALRCGWRALEIAKTMKYETNEIETLIQNISERIRKRNRQIYF